MCRDCKYFDTAFVGTSFATDYCRKDMQRVNANEEKSKECFEAGREQSETESGT